MKETIVKVMILGLCVSGIGYFVFGSVWGMLTQKKSETIQIYNQ